MNRPKVEEFEFLEEYTETLEIYCDQLEKALDKACEMLEMLRMSKEEWKKELMKDD